MTIAWIIANLFALAVITAIFAVIFKYLPSVPLRWRDVIIGSTLTAVLFSIGKVLISFYVAHGNFGTIYGAADSAMTLIIWVYYSAQIFFYGALFTHEYAIQLGSHIPRTPMTEVLSN